MPQLVLKPSIHDFSQEEVRAFLEDKRVRRMSAAIEHYNAVNAKIGKQQEKVQSAYTRKIGQLGRLLEKMEGDDDKVEKLLLDIQLLQQEMGLLTEKLHVQEEDTDDD